MQPGLHLITSNRIERLLELLAQELQAKPPSSALATETIVAPGPAMARWVNLQLARHNGIAANIHYPLPASWVWEIARALIEGLPEQDPLRPEAAVWKIFFLLPSLLNRPEFAAVSQYLRSDADDVKRWQLCAKIARLFDRYQFYRPNWIRAWCAGREGEWQAILWRELLPTIEVKHRVAVIDEALSRLNQSASIAGLPERISLFAISALPPLFVEVIQLLSRHTRVLWFLESPSEHYWADLSSKKTIARLRVHAPEKAHYHESGHELLASWGHQGQVLQDLLLSHEQAESVTTEIHEEPGSDCVLHRIQYGMFKLDSQSPLGAADDSLQIHVAHGPLRECQILHDQLLSILESDATLRPEDILVMVPEIGRYAPYIEAVFSKAENALRPFIPWNLSDTTVAEEHPLIAAFLWILRLPESRFTQSEILSILEAPEIAQHFELDAEAVETLRELIDMARVRWAIDGAHKQSLNLLGLEDNTWREAGRRFFAGYALGVEDLWHGIAPIGVVEGQKAVLIGKLWLLLNRLIDCRKELTAARSGADWQIYLNGVLERFFDEDESGRIQQIRDALEELAQAAAQEGILSRQLVNCWLQQLLMQKTVMGRHFSGGVSFCGMRQRALPFRVICLLGMNERAFPRREQKTEFDLMLKHRQVGDPKTGDEDRYLLLQALLCARQIFYISYSGRDPRDNSEREPSVLVRELLDFIDRYASPSVPDDKKPGANLIRVHPMQAFSPRNFQAGRKAYDKHWFRIASALANPQRTELQSAWPKFRLATLPRDSRRIELFRVHLFLKNPVKFFFNSRLKIRFREEAEIDDVESFDLNKLEQWHVKSLIIEDLLRNKDLAVAQIKAMGMLPHGALGPFCLKRIHEESLPLFDKLQEYRALTPETRTIEWSFAQDFELVGKIRNVYPEKGLLHGSASKFKGRHLLALWLDHLCLALVEGVKLKPSRLICLDQSWQFPVLEHEQAEAALRKILDQFLDAQERPLAILGESSHVWACGDFEGDRIKAYKDAESKWKGNPYNNIPGDRDDDYLHQVLRDIGGELLKDPEFERCSRAFYEDALKYAERL